MALQSTPTNIHHILSTQLTDFRVPLTRAHYLSHLRKCWINTLPTSLHSVKLIGLNKKGILFLSTYHQTQRHNITKDAQRIIQKLNATLPTHPITQLAFTNE